jgi:hypothetical protein
MSSTVARSTFLSESRETRRDLSPHWISQHVPRSENTSETGINRAAATGASLAARGRMDFPTLLQRVRSEFDEMPGLRLTPAQAGRLLGLDAPSCQRVITALVQSAFLRWTHDGTVVRAES